MLSNVGIPDLLHYPYFDSLHHQPGWYDDRVDASMRWRHGYYWNSAPLVHLLRLPKLLLDEDYDDDDDDDDDDADDLPFILLLVV